MDICMYLCISCLVFAEKSSHTTYLGRKMGMLTCQDSILVINKIVFNHSMISEM